MAKRIGKPSEVGLRTPAEVEAHLHCLLASGVKPQAAFKIIHDRLRDGILVAVSRLQLGLFWANETGAAFRDDVLIKYGCKGSSDILGCIRGGFLICLEVKTGHANLNENQRRFKPAIERWGGAYFVVRCTDDAVAAVYKVASRS